MRRERQGPLHSQRSFDRANLNQKMRNNSPNSKELPKKGATIKRERISSEPNPPSAFASPTHHDQDSPLEVPRHVEELPDHERQE